MVNSSEDGVTGQYSGVSISWKIVIVYFLGLAMYNVIELQILIFSTFTRFRGMYFWSLIIASHGTMLYCIGMLFKYFGVIGDSAWWVPILMLTVGWYCAVTGQAFILWSRLHLIVTGKRGERIIKYTKWMIILCVFIFHFPTTVLTFGANANIPIMISAYSVMEKIQLGGFFLQEFILSAIYIFEVIQILRCSLQSNTRRLMKQLIAINIVVIALDLTMIGVEAADLYMLQSTSKAAVWTIKFKLEFAVLSKLVDFVRRSSRKGQTSTPRFTASRSSFSTGGGLREGKSSSKKGSIDRNAEFTEKSVFNVESNPSGSTPSNNNLNSIPSAVFDRSLRSNLQHPASVSLYPQRGRNGEENETPDGLPKKNPKARLLNLFKKPSISGASGETLTEQHATPDIVADPLQQSGSSDQTQNAHTLRDLSHVQSQDSILNDRVVDEVSIFSSPFDSSRTTVLPPISTQVNTDADRTQFSQRRQSLFVWGLASDPNFSPIDTPYASPDGNMIRSDQAAGQPLQSPYFPLPNDKEKEKDKIRGKRKRGRRRSGVVEHGENSDDDISSFVDLSRVNTDYSYALPLPAVHPSDRTVHTDRYQSQLLRRERFGNGGLGLSTTASGLTDVDLELAQLDSMQDFDQQEIEELDLNHIENENTDRDKNPKRPSDLVSIRQGMGQPEEHGLQYDTGVRKDGHILEAG